MWWVVMLPGEDAGSSELYGPFRSEPEARRVAGRWNQEASADDQARVMPVFPAADIVNVTRY